jgi:hypothetical protein
VEGISKSHSVHQRTNNFFWRGILAFDRSHVSAALLSCVYISHNASLDFTDLMKLSTFISVIFACGG